MLSEEFLQGNKGDGDKERRERLVGDTVDYAALVSNASL